MHNNNIILVCNTVYVKIFVTNFTKPSYIPIKFFRCGNGRHSEIGENFSINVYGTCNIQTPCGYGNRYVAIFVMANIMPKIKLSLSSDG